MDISEDYINFLREVLQATTYSNGDPKVVYPLLEANLDKLNDDFAHILRTWIGAELSEAELAAAEYIAYAIWYFSYLINHFPLGNEARNKEIAIAGYEEVLKVFTRECNPGAWAAIQYNLGNTYSYRIRGDKAENLEIAIATYQQALSVYTKEAFPTDWARTQNNLGATYYYRIRGDKAENIERAIAAFQQALSVYTKQAFPTYWARIQHLLGSVYSYRIREDKAENIERAIAAFQQALSVYTKPAFPTEWAVNQYNLGIVYLLRIREDKAENLELAIAAYQQGLSVYTKEAFPKDWEATQYTLGQSEYDLGKLLVQDGHWYDRLAHLEQSLAIYRQLGELELRADTIYQMARTHHLMQNLDKAELYYRDALRLYEYIDKPSGIAICKTGLGRLMIQLGFIDDALQELNQSIELYDTLGEAERRSEAQEIVDFIKVKSYRYSKSSYNLI